MMGLKAIRMLLIGSQKYKKGFAKNKKKIRIWGISIRLLMKKLGKAHKVHFHSLLKLKFSRP